MFNHKYIVPVSEAAGAFVALMMATLFYAVLGM